eukprot:4330104-Karenia_brevis.AAC.1
MAMLDTLVLGWPPPIAWSGTAYNCHLHNCSLHRKVSSLYLHVSCGIWRVVKHSNAISGFLLPPERSQNCPA